MGSRRSNGGQLFSWRRSILGAHRHRWPERRCGSWAAAAKAIAGKAVERAAVDTLGFRFANVPAVDHPDFLPGGAKYFDLPGLLALSAPGELWLRGETPSAGSEAPANDNSDLALITAAYEAAGAKDKLTLDDGPAENSEASAVQWVLHN